MVIMPTSAAFSATAFHMDLADIGFQVDMYLWVSIHK